MNLYLSAIWYARISVSEAVLAVKYTLFRSFLFGAGARKGIRFLLFHLVRSTVHICPVIKIRFKSEWPGSYLSQSIWESDVVGPFTLLRSGVPIGVMTQIVVSQALISSKFGVCETEWESFSNSILMACRRVRNHSCSRRI